MLTVESINTYYGTSHILYDVSLEVHDGEIVVLLGRNGVGKTTTLKTIMGIQPCRSGKVIFNGEESPDSPPTTPSPAGEFPWCPRIGALFPI
jgi:ABC-type branched-subunit amino acid transport system ATPase component